MVEAAAVVERMAAAWNGGDLDGWLESFTADVDVHFRQDVPDPGPYHGRDELRRWAESFWEAWNAFRVELRETVPAGDHIVAEVHFAMRGHDTGIELAHTEWQVLTVHTDRISRWRAYRTRDEAMAAALTD